MKNLIARFVREEEGRTSSSTPGRDLRQPRGGSRGHDPRDCAERLVTRTGALVDTM